MEPRDEIEQELLDKLMRIESSATRNPQMAAEGLAAFLKEAEMYQSAVTKSQGSRHIGCKQRLIQAFSIRRKEFSPMSTFVTILLATSLLFGAGGVTIAAAQNSSPADALYSVKLLSEQARLDLINDPTTDFQLSLEFMGRRASEIQQMLAAGELPSEVLVENYQNRIEQTLQLALYMSDDQVRQSLELVRSRLVIQQQNFQQLQNNGVGDQAKIRTQIQEIIQTRILWTDDGISDPELLLQNLQDGTGSVDNSANGAGNPWTTGTPTPGSSYGPGPGDSINNTPNAFDYSGTPYTSGTPTPGSGYGPGSQQVFETSSTQPGYNPEDAGEQPGNEHSPTQSSPQDPPSTGKNGGIK
jgi:hypothetical protein